MINCSQFMMTDGSKMSTSLKQRKPIIKLPYKKGDAEITAESENQDTGTNDTSFEKDNSENTAGDKIQAESAIKTKKPAKVF